MSPAAAAAAADLKATEEILTMVLDGDIDDLPKRNPLVMDAWSELRRSNNPATHQLMTLARDKIRNALSEEAQ